VGTRLAVLAPLADVGLIVVDEEHDPAYKSDRTPRLQARDVAVALGTLAGAPVVLRSATPSGETEGPARARGSWPGRRGAGPGRRHAALPPLRTRVADAVALPAMRLGPDPVPRRRHRARRARGPRALSRPARRAPGSRRGGAQGRR